MTDATQTGASRRHQMFPTLSEAELARMQRFGSVVRFASGERLFGVGDPGPGMYVVLQGSVAVTQRDGKRAASRGADGPRRSTRSGTDAAATWPAI